MKNQKITAVAMVLLASALLTGCGEPKESPEEVMAKFKTAATEARSADFTVALDVNGTDADDVLDFSGKMRVKMDETDPLSRKADVSVALGGGMSAAGKQVEGDLAFDVRSLGQDLYVRLNKLESNDPSVTALKPFIKAYSEKWLQLTPDLIPENVRLLQQGTVDKEKEAQVKAAFVKADLFEVNKEYGVENVNGNKVHHYGVRVSEEGLSNYLRSVAAINGQTIPEEDFKKMNQFTGSVEDAQIWIGTEDYYLYKALAVFVPSAEQSQVEMTARVTMEANAYNKPVDIKAPENAEEFNPLALFMGGVAPAAQNSEGPLVPESAPEPDR